LLLVRICELVEAGERDWSTLHERILSEADPRPTDRKG
jgi:hypothetical protein